MIFGNDLTITTTGSTIIVGGTVPNYDTFNILGSGTLTGDTDIQLPGAYTPSKYERYTFYWKATMDLASYNITILGVPLTQEEVSKMSEMTFTYNGSTFDTVIKMANNDMPQKVNGTKTTVLAATGGAITINPKLDKCVQIFTNSSAGASLTGSHTITGATSGITDGAEIEVFYKCNFVAGSYGVSIFGLALTAVQIASGNIYIKAVFNGTAWVVTAMSGYGSDMYMVKATAADTAPSTLDGKVAKSITVVGNSAELVGDAVSPGNNKYYGTGTTGTKGYYPMTSPLNVTIELLHADLLTLNSVPFLAIAAQGANMVTVIESIIEEITISTPYATYTGFEAKTDTADIAQLSDKNVLISTVNRIALMNTIEEAAAGEKQLVANKGVYITCPTGDPTGGTAGQKVRLHIKYRVNDIS